MTDEEFVNGQPIRKKTKKRQKDESSFRLGYRQANLENQKKQIDQGLQMTLAQQIILHNMAMKAQDVLSQVNATQQGLNAQIANMMGPPPPGGGAPFAGPPPLPDMGGGMQPPQNPAYMPPPDQVQGGFPQGMPGGGGSFPSAPSFS